MASEVRQKKNRGHCPMIVEVPGSQKRKLKLQVLGYE